jgi:hypothetical protein
MCSPLCCVLLPAAAADDDATRRYNIHVAMTFAVAAMIMVWRACPTAAVVAAAAAAVCLLVLLLWPMVYCGCC